MPQITVATPCAAYNRMAQDWELIDALIGGTRTMWEKQYLYLSKEPSETEADYVARLRRSFLKPALRNAIEHGKGSVFRYEIDDSKVNGRLKPLLDDVDLLGNDLTSFLANAFGDMLTYGHCHLLAAFPTMVPGATLADAIATKARPYGVQLDPRNVFSWRRSEKVGPETPEEIRFFERVSIDEPGNEWNADAFSRRVRVLRPGEWQEWELTSGVPTSQNLVSSANPVTPDPELVGPRNIYVTGGQWQMIDAGEILLPAASGNQRDIPITTVYADRIDFMESRPPFLDLAWLNLRHWQVYSDYCNILHVAQVPMLFGPGMTAQDGPIVFGISSAVLAEDPNADLKWVEHSGKAIASGRQELLDLEGAMEKLGSALLSEDKRTGTETATAVAIDSASEQATLGGIVRALEDGANQFLWHMGRWLGLADAGSITISRPIALGGDQSTTQPGGSIPPKVGMPRGQQQRRQTLNA